MEFNNYKEVVKVLNRLPRFQNSIINSDDNDKNIYLHNLAKSFEIINKNQDYFIQFNWPNINEGREILDQTFKSILEGLKFKILNDIKSMSEIYVNNKSNKIKALNSFLKNIKDVEKKDKLSEIRDKILILKNVACQR